MNVSLVVAGHGHAAALVAPADGVAARGIAGDPGSDAYWEALAAAGAEATPVIAWRGDQHARFLLEPFPPLDFVLSTAPTLPLDPRASYVAEGQLRALFAPSLASLASILTGLADAGVRALVAGTPPPFADAERTRAALPDVAEDQRLSSSFTLQKLWSLLQTMTAEVAAQCGATFVPVPARVRDDDGFLREDYRADATHANAAYGTQMLAELAAAARSLSPSDRT